MWRTSIVLLCTVCVAANYFQGGTDLVSAPCLGCICEAATGCDLRFNCTRGLCGPLLISETYWRDAGRCTLQGDNPNWDGAFHRCVTDAWCAAWTVRNYMARHAQDCNRDGLLGCTDFALLHYLGASRCGARDVENLRFMRAFTECRSAISRLNG